MASFSSFIFQFSISNTDFTPLTDVYAIVYVPAKFGKDSAVAVVIEDAMIVLVAVATVNFLIN